MPDNQSGNFFSISFDVTFTRINKKSFNITNVNGVKLAHQKRTIFPRLLTYQGQEITTLINKSPDEDLLISKRKMRWLIRDILKHPMFIFVSLFSTRRFTIPEVNLTDLPVQVDTGSGNLQVWVSRHSIKSGIFPSNLDESLEYDRIRNPRQFSALVVNSLSENEFESSKLYRKLDYSFFLGQPDDSREFRLEYERFSDSEVLHGRIAVAGNRILQVSNIRKELIRREPMYLQEIGEKLAVLDTFKDLPQIEEGIYFGSNLNWFHFIVECLTRYTVIPEELSNGTPIILETGVHANIVELCRILSSKKPVLVGPSERLPVKKLLLCRELGVGDPIDPTPRVPALLNIRNRVWQELGVSTANAQPNEMYYFRRKGKLFRPLQNEVQLIKLLQPMGIKLIYPEDLTLGELLEIFSRTKLVVIESGAAITNFMFAPSTVTVIELIPNQDAVGLWENFLEPFGMDYYGVMGTPKYVGRKGIASDGFHIDTNEVIKIIKSLES
jgi:hypothetical protein